jgi:hypothetical protein
MRGKLRPDAQCIDNDLYARTGVTLALRRTLYKYTPSKEDNRRHDVKKTLLAGAFVVLAPASALALEAKIEKSLPMDAKAAWGVIRDFCGIAKWHPAVAECQLSEKDGKTFRVLTLKSGGKITGQLVNFDTAGMSYSYTIVESSLPVKGYKSTISIKPDGDKSTLTWVGNFEANGASDADAIKTITGIYDAGAAGIAGAK